DPKTITFNCANEIPVFSTNVCTRAICSELSVTKTDIKDHRKCSDELDYDPPQHKKHNT
ncbi:hypothetical protein E4U21_007823, partial [Claviceps maximensis]